jgi:hypothetical protein
MSSKNSVPNYLLSILGNKCPRCREGKIYKYGNPYHFKNNMEMHKACPSCGQPTEIEVGFYYGTGYVSYGLSVAFSVATFVAWKVLIGMTFSINDDRILYWMGTNITLLIIMQPILMRLSRTLWLSWFVSYDDKWKENNIDKPERVVEGQMNNW